MGLWYRKDTSFELTAFSYSDHAGCLDSRKTTSGGIQFLGGDKLVSWSSKKQDYTLMSSAKAEYVSLSACCAQVLWMRTQLTGYGFHFDKIPMYCDSKAAIAISCNPVQHSRTKYIEVRYHFIKEKVEKGIVKLFFVRTEYQLADLFTKALPVERFKYLVRRLGMRCLTPTKLEALEPKPLKKKQQIEMDKEYARKLQAELNKDIDWDVAINHIKLKAKEDPALDYFKGMSYDDIRPIFEAKFNSNVDFLLKTKEQMEEEESRALQTINETLAENAAKRRKLNEEVEDLKSHLEIVPDEDDYVYTKAIPLARKVPVVDYEIIEINNKPYYKIIRADGTHQLYISFLTFLKNFDKEDLETLWNLAK
nr:retrovirus-related Pol polyprotein from transposon TNT 1-94 [Tanacetum cinerariifolium]